MRHHFFGTTIAAAIDARIESSPFLVYKMFTGFAYLVGTLLLVILRINLRKNMSMNILKASNDKV